MTHITADIFRFAAILSVGEEYRFPTQDGKVCVISRNKTASGDEFYSFDWQDK